MPPLKSNSQNNSEKNAIIPNTPNYFHVINFKAGTPVGKGITLEDIAADSK